MYTACIIDDEPSATRTLALMLEKYTPGLSLVLVGHDPLEAIPLLEEKKPDLVFLDIQMPQMSGFDLLKKLKQIDFSIIFTTAHDRYAIEAIRFSALDYLLKPIDADELRSAVDRFIQKKQEQASNRKLYDNFLENIKAADQKGFKLALPTTEGTFFYHPEEIIRIEGENNYSRFHFTGHKPLLTSRTLKDYEEMLSPHGFIRVHKSHLVNKDQVSGYTAEGFLVLRDGTKVEMSRRRKEDVLATLRKK